MVILSHEKCGEYEFWDVQSQSQPTTTYIVTMDHEEGTLFCTCPDFIHRRSYLRFGGVDIDDDNSNFCKHIMEVLHEQ